jgi:hypothetical protein
VLGCWRERDGTIVSLPHAQRKLPLDVRRNLHARDYRPRGFPLLRTGESIVLRCRQVTAKQVRGCATRGPGTVVFTCRAGRAALHCTNRFGRGFVFALRSVDPI